MKKEIILASASPRRKELLELMGLNFQIIPAKGEEIITEKLPEDVVKELSKQKAREVADKIETNALVIGADTVVAYAGEIMGKPKDEKDAYEMLQKIQGNTHMVYTGVTVIDTKTQKEIIFAEGTKVSMYPMTKEDIWEYIDTKEPMDKAGAYAIQGLCSVYIEKIEGEYHNVVGLPIAKLYHELLEHGVDLKKM